MKIFLFLADKIKRRTHFLARSQCRWLIPGLQRRGRWGSPRSERSLPSDKSFSGSCKDVGHINRDMHHRDLKPESLWGPLPPRQASETSLVIADLPISYSLVFQHYSWPEFFQENLRRSKEQGASLSGRQTGMRLCQQWWEAKLRLCKHLAVKTLTMHFWFTAQIEAKQNANLRCLSSAALGLRCPTRLSVRPRAITGTVEKHLAIIHNRICV